MRAALGPAIAHLALLGAGFGVLRLVGALTPVGPRTVLRRVGLAYLVGVGVVTIVILAVVVAGVRLSAALFAVLCLLLFAPFALSLVRPASWRGLRPVEGLRALSPEGRVAAAIVVVLLIVAVIVTASVGIRAINQYDAWQAWTRKALLLFYWREIPVDFFTAHVTSEIKPDYPMLMPLFESLQMLAGGTPNEAQSAMGPWLVLVASIWAFCDLGARVTRPLVWAGLAGGAGILLIPPGMNAMADVSAVGFIAVGTLALGLWLQERRTPDLLVGAVLLAAASGWKQEGLGGALIAFAVVVVILGVAREWRPAALSAAVGAVALLVANVPWRLWVSAHHIKGSVTLSQSISPSYLIDHIDRFWPSVQAIIAQLTGQPLGQITVPVALALVVVSLRDRPRISVYYFAVGFLYALSLVWAYWTSPYDLGFHIFTSVSRIYIGPALIALVAVLHLSGESPGLEVLRRPRSRALEHPEAERG